MVEYGGGAFPRPYQGQQGMTLRDYFACKAMTVILERIPAMPNNRIADQAYGIADAMIAARCKETGGE